MRDMFESFGIDLENAMAEQKKREQQAQLERQQLLDQLATTNTEAESSYVPVGNALMATLGGLLGGGNIGETTAFGAASGLKYSELLERQEAEKRAQLEKQIAFQGDTLLDSQNKIAALNNAKVSQSGQLLGSYLTGDIPDVAEGNSPYQQVQEDRVKLAQAEAQARQIPLSAQAQDAIEKATGVRPMSTQESFAVTNSLNAANAQDKTDIERQKMQSKQVSDLGKQISSQRVGEFVKLDGPIQDSSVRKRIMEVNQATSSLSELLTTYRDKVASTQGPLTDAQRREIAGPLVALMTGNIDTLQNIGAGLSNAEKDLKLSGFFPAGAEVLNKPQETLTNWLLSKASGVDTIRSANTNIQLIQQSRKSFMNSYGFVSETDRELPPEKLEQLKRFRNIEQDYIQKSLDHMGRISAPDPQSREAKLAELQRLEEENAALEMGGR